MTAVPGAASTDPSSSTEGVPDGSESPSREPNQRAPTTITITPPATAATTGPLRLPESGCLCIESGQREAVGEMNHCLLGRLEAL